MCAINGETLVSCLDTCCICNKTASGQKLRRLCQYLVWVCPFCGCWNAVAAFKETDKLGAEGTGAELLAALVGADQEGNSDA